MLAQRRQHDAAARLAQEERPPEPGLERFYLLADGARRHGDLVAGLLEIQMARCGLEGAQGIERRQATTGHDGSERHIAQVFLGRS